jgi:hypothetical protein
MKKDYLIPSLTELGTSATKPDFSRSCRSARSYRYFPVEDTYTKRGSCARLGRARKSGTLDDKRLRAACV